MLTKIDYFKLAVGITLLIAGIVLWTIFPSVERVLPILALVVGFVIIFYSVVDLIPESGKTKPKPRFFVDSCRTIVSLLIGAAGIMIGVVARESALSNLIMHIAIGSLAASIIFGIIYIIILVAAVKGEKVENGGNIFIVDERVFKLGVVFLNFTWWFFIAGSAALAINFIASN